MNYEEEIKKIKTKVSEDEFKLKDEEFRAIVKNIIGIKEDNIEDTNNYLIGRWKNYLAKAILAEKMSKYKTAQFEGVILAVSTTDYGHGRRQEECLKMFRDDPEMAVQQGFTNAQGQPLGNKKFNMGKIMGETNISWQIEGAFKVEGEENYIPGVITSNIEIPNIPIGNALVKFEAGLKSNENNWLSLVGRRTTFFNVINVLSFEDLEKLFENHLKDSIYDIGKFATKAKDNKENPSYNQLVILKGDMGSDGVNILPEEQNSDVMSLIGKNIELDDEINTLNIVTIWLPKENKYLSRYIADYGENIYVVGVPGYSEDSEGNTRLSMNARGIFVDPKFIIDRSDVKEVMPTNSKVEVVDEEKYK